MANRRLTQDFDAHVPFTFARVPDSPPWANRWARLKRWCTIAFVESWLAVFLYRLKLRLRAAGVPLLPGVCDAIARALFRVQIGDRVTAGPGLMISHGNVVIDGEVRIGRNCQINPWVTIGLSNSKRLGFSARGPSIGDDVHIGTGAKVLGPIAIGDHVRIGANAVVIDDVPANVTVVGAPARPVGGEPAHLAQVASAAPHNGNGDLSGRDERLAAHMRDAIISYRLRRQSLGSLVGTLHGSFDIGSARLQHAGSTVTEEMMRLERATHDGAYAGEDLIDALDAINRALAPFAAPQPADPQPAASERS